MRRGINGCCLLRIAGLCLTCALVASASAQTPEKIEPYKPMPSTAIVVTGTTQGSGFLVDRADRLLLTNFHVAQPGRAVQVMFPIWSADGMVMARKKYYADHGRRIKGVCLAADPQRDLAVLQIDSVPAEVPAIKFADGPPRVGDKAHLLGNPANNDQVWVYGFGKVKTVARAVMDFGKVRVEARSVVLTTEDRRIGPGASGGPVVNDNGALVGVIQSGPADSREVCCIESSEVRGFLGAFYRKQATTAIAAKDYNRAIAQCTRALDINAADAVAHHERGSAYAFQTRYDEAVADYSAALKIDPQLSRTWRSRASAHYFLGKYDRAVEDCTVAIKLDPKYAQAYLSRSKAYDKLGDAKAAAADRERALKLNPALK